jgi:hypothetical protein
MSVAITRRQTAASLAVKTPTEQPGSNAVSYLDRCSDPKIAS